MAEQPETRFAKKVDLELKKLERAWFTNIQQVVIRGIPDRVGVVNGRFVALELKVSKTSKRAKLQEYVIDQITKAGGYARFCYPENFDSILKDLKEM